MPSRQPAEAHVSDVDPVARPVTVPEPAVTDDDQAGPALPDAGPADPQQRLTWLRERVLRNSADVAARRQLGQLLLQRGELALALDQYEAARAAQPDDTGVQLEQAEVLIALNRFDAVERDLRRIVKLHPENGRAHQLLGIANFRRGRYTQAEQDLGRALELMPDAATAYFYRGESLNQLNRVDDALAMIERAVQLDPGNARAYYVMGILYDKKSQPQEAAVMFRRAREVGAS